MGPRFVVRLALLFMCGGAEAFGDSKCKEGALEKAFTFVASGVLGKVPGWDPPVSELQVGDECSLVSFPQALGGLPEIRGLFSQMITEIQKGRERETTLLVQMKEGEGREKAFHAQIKEGEGREKALHAQIKEGEGREKALHTQIKEGEGREKALHAQIKEGKGREKALHAQIKEGEGREKALHAQVKEGGERVRTLEVQNNGLNRDLPICVDQLESTRKEKEQAWTTCGSLQKTTRDEAERDAKGAIQILSCLCFCLLLPFLYIILNPISAQRSSRRGLPKLESTLPQKATIFPKQTLRLTLPATAPIIPIQRIPQTAKIPTHAPAANELLQDTNASVNTPPQPTPDPSVDAPAEPDPTPPVDAPAEAPPTPPVDAPAEAPPTPPVDAPAEALPTPPVDAPAKPTPTVTPPVDAPAEPTPTPPVDAPAEPTPTPSVDSAIQTHSRVCLPHALLYNLNFATFLITNLNPNLNKNQMMSKLKEWLCQWRVNNLSDIRARAVFGKFGIALLIPLIDRPGQREAISKLSNMTATWREWRLQRARDGHDVSTELQISAKGGRSAHDIEMAYEEILSPWRYSDDQLVSY